MGAEAVESKADLEVKNVGGIDEMSVSFEPGVTVLAGRNATNRTSLLQAVMAALGSDDVSIKADADEAHVELALGGETYTRTLERRGGTVQMDGDPYLEDSTVADLFAFLLESNEARRAVVTDADLRDVIMRPVDTDEIQAEIDRLLERRREIEAELEELDGLKDRLPGLEEERTRLEGEIADKRAALEELEADIEAADADLETRRDEQAELEEKLETLREKRSTLEGVRYDLETEKESLESLQAEQREVESEYEGLPEAPMGDLEEVESRIDRLRGRKQRLETELNELQSVIGFNQEMLDGGPEGAIGALEDGGSDADGAGDAGALTDELLAEGAVTCWTCGSEVDPDQIETTIERLRSVSQDTVGDINDIEEDLEALKEQRREKQEAQRRRERLERRRRELGDEVERAKARIEELSERRDGLREEIAAVEAAVDELETDANEEILDRHREANQLEYDLGSLETDLERVEEEIATVEGRLDEECDLETRHEEVNEEIESLRTRIGRIETRAVENFNEHMETVLDRLGYDNLDRIWLERTEREVREGRRTVTKSVFDLHIVRQTASGVTYEDTVDNLSESEREVTGLVFALAGYLAHEVYETVPFLLLDSLEAIDAGRIGTLVDYIAEFSPYLVVALLPEDAEALPDEDTLAVGAAAGPGSARQ